MSTERDALFQGVEGAGGPPPAAVSHEKWVVSTLSSSNLSCLSGLL